MDGGLLSFIPGISLVNRGCENAHHVFRKMFVGRSLNATESIFAQYYVSSLTGKNLNKGDDTKWTQAKWVNAIWDIRTQFSQFCRQTFVLCGNAMGDAETR
jgi:hypothetical protein